MDDEDDGDYIPLGPVEGSQYVDDFTYEQVKESTCTAQMSINIAHHLITQAEQEGVKYLCVCVPCYNEDFEELLKTLLSLMENFDFMIKKVGFFPIPFFFRHSNDPSTG